MILIYLQNLHEDTDAKGVSLYFNKYDFLQGEEKDSNSLINAWTLKPRKNKQVMFDDDNPLFKKSKIGGGSFDHHLKLLVQSLRENMVEQG